MTTDNQATPAPSTEPAWRSAIDNPWIVLGLLFFVMAICGLPILWLSRAFSTPMKALLSLVVTIYTLALFGCTAAVVWWSFTTLQDWFAG